MALNIKKVSAVPVPDGNGMYPGNTLYFVSTQAGIELWLTSDSGDSISHVPTQNEILTSSVARTASPPPLPNAVQFWMDPVSLTLYVQHDDGTTVQWVEAIPSHHVPEFGGNGTAITMARSDHNHDDVYATVGPHEW